GRARGGAGGAGRRRIGGGLGRTGAAGGAIPARSRQVAGDEGGAARRRRSHRGRTRATTDPGSGAKAVALRLRTLRVQGPAVLLAVPGMQPLGHLRAEAQRGAGTWLNRSRAGPGRPGASISRAPASWWPAT